MCPPDFSSLLSTVPLVLPVCCPLFHWCLAAKPAGAKVLFPPPVVLPPEPKTALLPSKTAMSSAPGPPLDPLEMQNVSRIWPWRPPGPLLGGTRSSPEASKMLQEASRGLQEASRGLQEASKSTLKPPEQLPGPEMSCSSLEKPMKSNDVHEIHCWVFKCCQEGSRSYPAALQRPL